MCDYSLESFARRDAQAGDRLKTAKIGGYGSVGLVAPEAPQTAVCLRPGTKLIVSGIPDLLRKSWNVGQVAIATFTQRDASGALGLWRHGGYHRDGVRFDGGREFVLFQEFPAGLDVSVEMVPGEQPVATPPDAMPETAEPELILA